MHNIKRLDYIDKLLRVRSTPDIKVLTGVRHCGKTQILNDFIEALNEDNPSANIIWIDLRSLEHEGLKDYMSLYEYVEGKHIDGVENVLIIDEVQLCNQFELAINSFHNSRKYDIYITGSNAFLLSSDLATLFTGRFIQISVYPFSYKEYCQYFEVSDPLNHLEDYLKKGGLAGSYVYQDNHDAMSYIKDVYNTLIKRDLIDKYSIGEVALLDTLSDFLMDNMSNLCTINNITNTLKGANTPVSHVTVGNYIKYLCNAFMFYKVKRYDIKGKKYLETNDKYYLVDLSLRYALLGTRNMDYGRAYENIVALELMRRNYDIYVGKLYKKEVDFVAMKGTEKIYIQVSDNISDEKTLERELAPLQAIRDAYPKILLANTHHDTYDIEGIQVIDIAHWLLEV